MANLMGKSGGSNRRTFLKSSAAVGAGFWVAGGVARAASSSPNEQIQVAAIGVGGKGDSDCTDASEFAKIHALCDVDSKFLKGMALKMKARKKPVDADKLFADYRELLDKLGDQIDAVIVSTPDHMHAPIASKALSMGKHVYCQKPLTRTIFEARRLGELAAKYNCVTQMGNQFTAFNPMREAAAQIAAGQIGTVKEVHLWTNRPIWPQGEARPAERPIPPTLNWELWQGVAAHRPYGDGYHPFKWRGWWDYGTGALGDMACHTANLPFKALNMRDPISVEAQTAGHNGDSYPAWSKIRFEFPELDGRAAFTMNWYDGGQKPDASLTADMMHLVPKSKPEGDPNGKEEPRLENSGCLFIGDKGKFYAGGDYAEICRIFSDGVEPMKVDYVQSPGHVQEFYDGIRDRSKVPVSNFTNYGGPLTETILLGNLAVWKQGRVEWDAKTMTPLNDSSLAKIVKPEYQNGFELYS